MENNKQMKDIIKELNYIKEDITQLKQQQTNILDSMDMIKLLFIKNRMNELNLNNYCPICGEFSNFDSFGNPKREKAQCPHCKSLERQRLTQLVFIKKFDELLNNKNIKLLHFAPEFVFYKYFNAKSNIDYYPVDINPDDYLNKQVKIRDIVNMEEIPYENNTFDIIYNSHVLEHVPDDIKAMNELYRVLKDKGVCITLIPHYKSLDVTFENKNYNTPELREKYFGQKDHLRKYGKDFKDRLNSVGFHVEEVMPLDIVKTEFEKKTFGLIDETVFICTK